MRARPKLRRRYRRRTVRVQVEYEQDGRKRSDTATTLGAGGMFISTPTPLDEQTRFIVRFQIPNSDRTHVLEARVVWANWPMEGTGRSAGMGIEFIDSRECKALALELEQLEEA